MNDFKLKYDISSTNIRALSEEIASKDLEI